MNDTLILGGGLAGTAAALWLADLGRTAPLIEARGAPVSRQLARLAFAGSDLYSDAQGWFEGALLTARAAITARHNRLQKA